MYLHSRNVIAQPVVGSLNYATDLIGKGLATFNVMVCIDLDLHNILFLQVRFAQYPSGPDIVCLFLRAASENRNF